MNCAITVLYNPNNNELTNILSYVEFVDLIIIMDNSENNHSEDVKDLLSKRKINCHVEYRYHAGNIGLCKALNRGMQIANIMGCKWALLLDSDSSPTYNIVKIYENYLKKHDNEPIAVLSPVHIFDRSKNHSYKGEKIKKWAMTSGCYYNIDIFNLLNGFNEELFVDGLDMDYGYKARQNGYKIIEIGEATLKHNPGETRVVSLLGKKIFYYGYASPWRYYLQAKSLIWLIFKYKAFEQLLTYFYKWFKVLFLFDNKKEYVRCLKNGTREGLELVDIDKTRGN